MMTNKGLRREIRRSDLSDGISETKTTEAASVEVDAMGMSGLAIRSPNSSVSAVTVFAAESTGGTYSAVEDADGSPVVVDLNGSNWRVVNTHIFPFRFLKFVTDAEGQIEWVGKS